MEDPIPLQILPAISAFDYLEDNLDLLEKDSMDVYGVKKFSGSDPLLLMGSSVESSHSNVPKVSFHFIDCNSSIIKHIEALNVEQVATPIISVSSDSLKRKVYDQECDISTTSLKRTST